MTIASENRSRSSAGGAALRTPPQSPDMERALLGALLLDGSTFGLVSTFLDETSFYRPAYGIIYGAMHHLDAHHEPIDIVTVTEQLRAMGKLEEIGGAGAVLDVIEAVPSAANVEHYARSVHEKAVLRKIISLNNEGATLAYEPGARADEILEKIQSSLVELVGERRGRHAFDLRRAMHDTMDYIGTMKASGSLLRGVGTGFEDIDYYTSGFASGEFIIIAARPSMGKTSLAMNIAINASTIHNMPVLIFSLEMEVRQIAIRMLSAGSHILLQRLRGTYHLQNEEYSRLSDAAGRLADLPIFIDDSAGLSIQLLRARARQLWIEQKIGMIVIDYLQLITPPKMADNQQQWISYVSASLKSLAKELKVPVVCLSQLSRAPEMRGGDRKPMLSDLRDSGAIEQDADVVMFVYRPWMYKGQFKEGMREYEIQGQKYEFNQNLAEIIVAKNRNGPTGSLPLTWVGEYTMFASMSKEHPTYIPGETASPSVTEEAESDGDQPPF